MQALSKEYQYVLAAGNDVAHAIKAHITDPQAVTLEFLNDIFMEYLQATAMITDAESQTRYFEGFNKNIGLLYRMHFRATAMVGEAAKVIAGMIVIEAVDRHLKAVNS